jgi:hypothetical protein
MTPDNTIDRFLTSLNAHPWIARLVYVVTFCVAVVLGYLGNKYVW